jgi:hypothetical protein
MRMSLVLFFWLVRINTWRRRWLGQPVESRRSW